jgi:hypothetical protein
MRRCQLSQLDPLFCEIHQPESQATRGGVAYPHPAITWGVHIIYISTLITIHNRAVTTRGWWNA